MRERLPLPGKIQNAPELELGLELFWSAFWDLNSSRPIGLDEGPIRWVDIWDYCDRMEIYDEQREDLLHHIKEMDQAYRKFRASKAPKPNPTPVGGKRHGR